MTENDPEEREIPENQDDQPSTNESGTEIMVKENIGEDLDIEELAKEYELQEREPRPMAVQVLISLSFLFGPIFLVIDIFSDTFLGPFGNLLSYIVMGITAGLVGVIFFKAWRLANKIE